MNAARQFAAGSSRCAVPVLVLLLQGCGTTILSSRESNPVIQDFAYRWLSDDSALSTTASRRLALMSYRRNGSGQTNLVTCAEPPPDVGETFAKALALQLEAAAPKAAGEAKIGVSFNEQIATAIAPLMVRTQGLQILRDSAFTLCVDYMNGWITDAETYMRIKEDRFNKALRLISEELPLLPRRLAVPEQPLASPSTPPAGSSVLTPAAASSN
jgi:hypothetical protein